MAQHNGDIQKLRVIFITLSVAVLYIMITTVATPPIDSEEQFDNASTSSRTLFFLVLSSRSGSEQRQLLRSTWLQHADKLQYSFLVGKEYCPYSLQFRKFSYTCEFNNKNRGGVVKCSKRCS